MSLRATKSVSALSSITAAPPCPRGDGDEALGGDAVGLLGGVGKTLDAQPVDGRFHVASGFGQRLLAIHHASAGFFAQFFHHGGGDFGHGPISIVLN